MKKLISVLILIVSVLLFIWLIYYGELPYYNYHLAYVAEYVLYWGVTLFILSLFAFVLNDKKYKLWFLITIPFVILSILLAYDTDMHDALFSGQYVILWIISLYSITSLIYFIIQFFKNRKASTLAK